jgi:carbon monoxide dehydrogenase subunit G
VLVVLALASVAAAEPPQVEALTAADGVHGLRATFDVAGDPDVVLQTLWDVDRFRAIFPDIKSLTVLSSRKDGATEVDVQFFVDAVFRDVSYTLRRRVDRLKRTVTWRAIGGDLAVVRGSWSVQPTSDPAMARVTYTSFVDVGYLVPTGMVRDVALGKVKHMAERVRAACAPVAAGSR